MHSTSSSAPHQVGTRQARVVDLGRLLLGLSVVALGILFLLDSAGSLDAGRAIDHWWPLVVIAAGGFTLAERPPSALRGTLLVAVGALLLLFSTHVLDDNAWDYVWPAAIIAVGAVIVARWNGRTISGGASPEDAVRSTAVFGGSKLVSAARQFEGAWLTAIFGGITLDLHDAELAPDGASINATVAFGGIDIVVPRGWRISVRSTPILGGVDDKTDRTQPPPSDAPTLHVDAVCVFGGVDIKHDK